MLDLYKKILKINHFTSHKEKSRAFVFSLIALVSIVIMLVDIYYSKSSDYFMMRELEMVLVCLTFALYFLFPKVLTLNFSVNVFSFFIILFILFALIIPGHNQEFSFFALAIIPPVLYFLLGLEIAKYWNIAVVVLLSFIVLNTYFGTYNNSFEVDLLFQVLIAYIVISVFYYYVELERTNYEESLKRLIEERDSLVKSKNILLKEIHHRAKNNLQTVMGLLESQAMRIDNTECKKVLTSQRHRLQSMSLLHENLALDTNFELVNMKEYLTQIIHGLQIITQHEIVYRIAAFRMAMSQAVHLALFLNEALSNAIEHAYPTDEMGVIEVDLERDGLACTLCVKDFGKGFETDTSKESLGLILMDDIINFFKDGRLEYHFEQGTAVCAHFTLERIDHVSKT